MRMKMHKYPPPHMTHVSSSSYDTWHQVCGCVCRCTNSYLPYIQKRYTYIHTHTRGITAYRDRITCAPFLHSFFFIFAPCHQGCTRRRSGREPRCPRRYPSRWWSTMESFELWRQFATCTSLGAHHRSRRNFFEQLMLFRLWPGYNTRHVIENSAGRLRRPPFHGTTIRLVVAASRSNKG